MRDVLDRIDDEIKKARFRKDTTLISRLNEVKREVEYLRESMDSLCALEDKHLPRSLRVFVDLTRKGEKAGLAHPLFSPDGISNFFMRLAANRGKTANV